jgi:hypothetical protein
VNKAFRSHGAPQRPARPDSGVPRRVYIDRGAKRRRDDLSVLEDQIDVRQRSHDAYDKPASPAARLLS